MEKRKFFQRLRIPCGYTDKSCNKSVYILLQQADTDQDAFASLATAVKRLVAGCQQTCCKLIIPTGLLQVVSTSCNKSANDKLQKA